MEDVPTFVGVERDNGNGPRISWKNLLAKLAENPNETALVPSERIPGMYYAARAMGMRGQVKVRKASTRELAAAASAGNSYGAGHFVWVEGQKDDTVHTDEWDEFDF